MTWYAFEIKNEEAQERRFRMRTEFNVIYEANKDKFKGTALIALKPVYRHFLKSLKVQTKTPLQTLSTVSNKEVLS